MLDDVHADGRFADARARGEDDKVGLLQTVRDLIQLCESRIDAAESVLIGGDHFKFIQHAVIAVVLAHIDEG